jgi:hypothetical protein
MKCYVKDTPINYTKFKNYDVIIYTKGDRPKIIKNKFKLLNTFTYLVDNHGFDLVDLAWIYFNSINKNIVGTELAKYLHKVLSKLDFRSINFTEDFSQVKDDELIDTQAFKTEDRGLEVTLSNYYGTDSNVKINYQLSDTDIRVTYNRCSIYIKIL